MMLWKAYTIGQMSADKHKQIGILRGATSFNVRIDFIQQNKNFEKSHFKILKFKNL
jgi:hypothetical protein